MNFFVFFCVLVTIMRGQCLNQRSQKEDNRGQMEQKNNELEHKVLHHSLKEKETLVIKHREYNRREEHFISDDTSSFDRGNKHEMDSKNKASGNESRGSVQEDDSYIAQDFDLTAKAKISKSDYDSTEKFDETNECSGHDSDLPKVKAEKYNVATPKFERTYEHDALRQFGERNCYAKCEQDELNLGGPGRLESVYKSLESYYLSPKKPKKGYPDDINNYLDLRSFSSLRRQTHRLPYALMGQEKFINCIEDCNNKCDSGCLCQCWPLCKDRCQCIYCFPWCTGECDASPNMISVQRWFLGGNYTLPSTPTTKQPTTAATATEWQRRPRPVNSNVMPPRPPYQPRPAGGIGSIGKVKNVMKSGIMSNQWNIQEMKNPILEESKSQNIPKATKGKMEKARMCILNSHAEYCIGQISAPKNSPKMG